ncbi:MAG: dihydroorotase [Lachnospiraceae bacterium]|nr:dihydroorotase [Lachnospiraceae bacterium]
MAVLLMNGRILDPANGIDEIGDVLVVGDRIAAVETGDTRADITKNLDEAVWEFDATDCFIMPGLIDLHVHLREPGLEYKETIATGAMAAARGGVTTICAMPNTSPSTDNPERVKLVVDKAKAEALVHVLPVGAVTIGQMGKEMTDIAGMAKAGICAISEDGKSVMDSGIYRKAMKEAKKAGVLVMAHCEDINLVEGGVINAGAKCEEFGVKGITNAVEDIITARDIMLAQETGVQLHLCHCSTKDSVRMIKEAKALGLPVTGEVCPHHFILADSDMDTANSNFKMNPPLRSKEDVEALKEGLRDGIMDCISTDHAPHSAEEKARPMDKAPFGIVGLETSVPLTYTYLVENGYLTPLQMAEKMSYNPAKVLGIDKGTLGVGKAADITVINPKEAFKIDPNEFASKGKNTPFGGYEVRGRVKLTMVDGQIVFND